MRSHPLVPSPIDPTLLVLISDPNEQLSDYRALLPLTEERARFLLAQMDAARREAATAPLVVGRLVNAEQDPWHIGRSRYVGDTLEWEDEDPEENEGLDHLNGEEPPIGIRGMQMLLESEENGDVSLLTHGTDMRMVLLEEARGLRTTRMVYEVNPSEVRLSITSDANGEHYRSRPIDRGDLLLFLCRVEPDARVVADLVRQSIEASPHRALHLLGEGAKLVGEEEGRDVLSLLQPTDLQPLLESELAHVRQAAMTLLHRTLQETPAAAPRPEPAERRSTLRA